MKKHILKILIITLLLAPFFVPVFADNILDCEVINKDTSLGESCTTKDGGGGGGGGTTSTPPAISTTPKLTVSTDAVDPNSVTQTTATLQGHGGIAYFPGCASFVGYSVTTGQPCNTERTAMTAYFRYSKAAISPIFCNDIYGTNMLSTKDIFLGTSTSTFFRQPISNLTPNTTYYYCAIISNKDNIAYGGSSIVKNFTTIPLDTTITTKDATQITSTSAVLNGSYNAIKNVKTYFQYKKSGDDMSYIKIGEQSRSIGNLNSINGKISFPLTELTPSTTYIFMAIADDSIPGDVLSFTTNPSDDGGTTSTTTGGTGWTGGGSGTETSENTCPTGWTGVWPTCTAVLSCPTGWSGTYPSCNAPSGGTVGIGTSRNCPTGWSGTYPSCNAPMIGGNCPIGWTGIYPSCTANVFLGQTATPPNDAIVRFHEGIETVFVRQIISNQIFTKTYGYREGTDLLNFAWNLADQFARVFGYISSSGKEIRVSFPDIAAYQLQLVGNKLTVYEYYNNKIVDIRNITTVFKNASGYEYYFQK